MEYVIKTDWLPVGLNNDGTCLTPNGITAHSTGTCALGRYSDQDESESRYFHERDRKSSAHMFIDPDSMTELIPWRPGQAVRAWHACHSGNSNFIGVEFCEQMDHLLHMETWKRYVWIIATMCFLYEWDPYDKITVNGKQLYRVHSHHDVTTTFHESDHVDPDAYFASHSHSMDDLRHDVKYQLELMKGVSKLVATFADLEGHWAKAVVEEVAGRKTAAGSPIMGGFPDGTFRPNEALTRAQAAVITSRMLAIVDDLAAKLGVSVK